MLSFPILYTMNKYTYIIIIILFFYRTTDIFEENYQYLEKTVIDLRMKVKKFMTFHKTNLEHLEAMKSQLRDREGNNKDVETKLNTSIKKLDKMKYTILELTKLKKKYFEVSKQNGDLLEHMKNCAKAKQVHEEYFEKCRKELEMQLDHKNKELARKKSEMANMAVSKAESETTVTLLRDKYKELFRVSEQSKQIVNSLKIKLQNKEIEKKGILDKILALQVELEKSQKKSCNYCGL